MGFFYQALKKATGVATDAPEDRAHSETSIGLAEPRTATTAVAPVMANPRRKLSLKFPLESLVAFLTPPIEDQNVNAMEHCRVLRARIWEVLHSKNMKSLLMTSAMPGDGKTLLSVNMAFALNQIENARILLVDVDMRRPSVSQFLNIMPDKGLNSFLQDGDGFDDVCWTINESLDLVPTLPVEENSSELLHGKRMVEFLAQAKERYDIVLMDGPPLFPIVDAQVLAPLVDAAILVVRAGKTPFDISRQAAELLQPKFIGSILNGAEQNKKSSYYGGYYRYGGPAAKKKK